MGTDSLKKVRGASYPVIDLEKAIVQAKNILDAVGKASASKQDIAKAVGYSGINGKSKRVIAALIQYGLITGRASEHRLTELALQILFPEDENARQIAIRHAAIKPGLFGALAKKYEGDSVPGLLPNILVTSHGINPNSGDEAAKVFRSTLEFANMLDENGKIVLDGGSGLASKKETIASDELDSDINNDESSSLATPQIPADSTNLNRIEIVLREGIKAGIYAPYQLTQEEKSKLKSIIDLL